MKRILTNYAYVEVDGNPKRRGLPAADIAQQLVNLVHPIKLRRIGATLVAIDDVACVHTEFRKESHFFGWIASKNIASQWSQTEGMLTKSEFVSMLACLLPEIVGVRDIPHEPPIPSFHYMGCADYGREYTGRLDELVNFWKPATDFDRALMKAAFCTPLWGGRPGGRPALSIESDGVDNGRGVGKSTLMYAISKIGGGSIDCRLTEDMDQIKKRILTSSASVVCFDNCKTSKISSGDLEGLITAPAISGWRLHVGNGMVANHLTYAFSMNDASFSADMSSRSVRIVLSRQKYGGTWDAQLDQFIEKHRAEIIGDCIWLLRQQPSAHHRYIRFSAWQLGVLSKIDATDAMADLLLSRQEAVDADAESSDEMRGIIASSIAEHARQGQKDFVLTPLDPGRDCVLISRAVLCDWLRKRTDRQATDQALTKSLKRAKVLGLEDKGDVRHGIRYWRWEPLGPTTLEGAWRIDVSDVRKAATWHEFRDDRKEGRVHVMRAAPEVHPLSAPDNPEPLPGVK